MATATTQETTPRVVLCCWCDEPATRNLDSFHDVCCDAHHAVWFEGEAATPRCDCETCKRYASRCPQCVRPAVGRAFGTTANYDRCANGHVFPSEVSR